MNVKNINTFAYGQGTSISNFSSETRAHNKGYIIGVCVTRMPVLYFLKEQDKDSPFLNISILYPQLEVKNL